MENIVFNDKRVSESRNENEIWNIAKEVSNPKSNDQWELKTSDTSTTKDTEIIADTFNSFFSEKIINLQTNIDKSLIEDPLTKLKNKDGK